jgi:hypothetical protein
MDPVNLPEQQALTRATTQPIADHIIVTSAEGQNRKYAYRPKQLNSLMTLLGVKSVTEYLHIPGPIHQPGLWPKKRHQALLELILIGTTA